MPGWSLNPFWEDDDNAVEDLSLSSTPLTQTAPEVSVKKPTTTTAEKKKRTKAVPKKSTAQPTALLQEVSSESEEEPAPSTSKPKRKRLQSEIEKPLKAVKAASFLSQRGSSGYTTQRDPARVGEYYVELRVYNSAEIERSSPDLRWKQALTTLKLSTDTDTELWRALSRLIQAGKEEFKHCQPIMYPLNAKQ